MNLVPVAVVSAFIALDVLTGIAKAFATTGFDSSVMREGFYHKIAELLAIVLAYAVDYGLPTLGVPVDVHLSAVCCIYLSFMEVGSIIENLGKINPDLVGPLNKIFAKLREGENEIK